MDPLSVTVGTLAIVTAITEVVKFINRRNQVPEHIHQIAQDVSDFEGTLLLVKQYLSATNNKSPEAIALSARGQNYLQIDQQQTFDSQVQDARAKSGTPQEADLANVIASADKVLKDIHDTLKCVEKSQGSRTVLFKSTARKWRLNSGEITKLKHFQSALQIIQLNLTVALGAVTLMKTVSTQEMMQDLYQTLSVSRASQKLFQRRMGNHLFSKRQELERIKRFGGLSKMLMQQQPERKIQHGHLYFNPNEHTTSSTTVTCATNPRKQIQQNDDVRYPVPLQNEVESCTKLEISENCDKGCSCSCHSVYSKQTWSMLRPIIGTVSFDIIPLDRLRAACNQQRCRRRSNAMLQVGWTLPTWIVLFLVSAKITTLSLQSCSITFKACRIVPDLSSIFRFALEGNLTGIEKLLTDGEASIYDVDASTNSSALVYATYAGRMIVWKYLLKKGADPYEKPTTRRTPIDIAFEFIHGQTERTEIIEALKRDFDMEDYLEQRQFPILHKIVLGLAEADLEKQLRLSTAEVNAIDHHGRTALSWAAICGNLKALTALLKYKADPNLVAFNRDAPLHYAARAYTPECIQPLLESGADPNAQNSWQVTPVFYTTADRDDPRYLRPLIDYHADLNLCDKHGRTTLIRAVINNRVNLVKGLLENGADPTKQDRWGVQPLELAIKQKNKSMITILLEKGGKYFNKNHVSHADDTAEEIGDAAILSIIKNAYKHSTN